MMNFRTEMIEETVQLTAHLQNLPERGTVVPSELAIKPGQLLNKR